MITFGDGAHGSMVRMLQMTAEGGWTVELLREDQEPERPDSLTVTVDRVDGEGLTGWVVNDLGGRTSPVPQTFAWVDYPRVHIF